MNAVSKMHVSIKLCYGERADQNVWNALYNKAVDVSANYHFTQQCPDELVVIRTALTLMFKRFLIATESHNYILLDHLVRK